MVRNCRISSIGKLSLADLSALCLHLSTRLVTLTAQPQLTPRLNTACLTARQAEITELVAQGLTNAEIGATLCITERSVKQALKRMFRKLEVSSRAEIVARLSTHLATAADNKSLLSNP
ncbi:helix-turn-helix transcriptional regulator [Leptolyngbya sp. 7M]|nr:helix-turn-helix transcriptional regulator [Leptolyngbya sp. 7M]